MMVQNIIQTLLTLYCIINKSGWYEALEGTYTPDAEDVLDNIIGRLDFCDCYYDGMEDVVSSLVLTDENKRKLQGVLG